MPESKLVSLQFKKTDSVGKLKSMLSAPKSSGKLRNSYGNLDTPRATSLELMMAKMLRLWL